MSTLTTLKNLPLRAMYTPEISNQLAIGWWMIFVLTLLFLFFCGYCYQKLTRKTAIKTAKKILKILKNNSTQTPQEKLEIISTLLRRVAISCHDRSNYASLTGKNWLLYLDSSFKENPFSEQTEHLLILTHYQKQSQHFDINNLILLVERWLKIQKDYAPF